MEQFSTSDPPHGGEASDVDGAPPRTRNIRAVAVTAAACAVGALVFAVGGHLVEHVEFVGQTEAEIPALRHLSDLGNGATWWGVDLEAVERGVERHPWVRDARAHRVWPDTVVVEVEEHHAAALLHDGGRLLLVSDAGVPFLPAGPTTLDLPHLTGFGPGLEELHPDLPVLAVRHALWLVETLDARGLVPRRQVDEVSFSRASGYVVLAGPAEIGFGLADLPRQIDRLAMLVAGGMSLASPTSVDLAPATVAIVRPRVSAGASGGS